MREALIDSTDRGELPCLGDAARDLAASTRPPFPEARHSGCRNVSVAPESTMGWDNEYGRLERLDMDPINHPFHVDTKRKPPDEVNVHQQTIISDKETYSWILTIVIGVTVALIARFVQLCISTLCDLRNNYVQDLIQSSADHGRNSTSVDAASEKMLHAASLLSSVPEFLMETPFIFFTVWNLCFVLIGAIITAVFEPHTAADGIAEIKAFINGTHVKNFLRLRTIIARVFSTIFAASSGLASGSEGPLIHIGAGVGSGVTRGDKLRSCHSIIQFSPAILGLFHNDRDRREFVSAGAAAGMAAAFGSPIGGVLWVLEETNSAWTPSYIWRMFTASLLASVTLAFLRVGYYSGDVSVSGLLSFGNVRSSDPLSADRLSVVSPIYWWEILLFAGVGAVGGVLGVLFNKAVNILASIRPRWVWLRVLEVLAVSLLTSLSIYTLVFSSSACKSSGLWTCRDAGNWGDWCSGPDDMQTCVGPTAACDNATAWICRGGRSDGQSCRDSDCEPLGGECMAFTAPSTSRGMRMRCAEGEYHEIATLLWGHHEQSIVRILAQDVPTPYSNASLLQASGITGALMVLTFGIHISTGIFMPLVFVGTCLGRVAGQMFKEHIDARIFAGGYALAGAAALLGGVQRGTISLVIILIEGTGNVHSLLPVVTAICVSNFVGNLFGGREGIYDMLIRRKRLRWMDHQPSSLMEVCFAGDVMTRPPVSLRAVEKLATIVEVLRSTPHHGFPVVSLAPPDDADSLRSLQQPQQRESANTRRGARREAGADGVTEVEEEGTRGDASVPHRMPSATGEGRLEGMILRSTLRVLLAARFHQVSEGGVCSFAISNGQDRKGREGERGRRLSLWERITAQHWQKVSIDGDKEMYELLACRRYTGERRTSKRHAKTWESATFSDADMEQYINIAPYMNASPYYVAETSPLIKAFTLFQHMTLRHLVVVDHLHRPVGMITNDNLTDAHLRTSTEAYLNKSDISVAQPRYLEEDNKVLAAASHKRYRGTARMLALKDRLALPLASGLTSQRRRRAEDDCRAASTSTSTSLPSSLPCSRLGLHPTPERDSTDPAVTTYFTGGPLGSWQQRVLATLNRLKPELGSAPSPLPQAQKQKQKQKECPAPA